MMSHGTLADRLAEQKVMSPVAVRRVALDLLSALGAAHDAGMVHRDVKPANVLFDGVGNAKLADFGAAHLADFGQTQTGGLMGTVAYMSPEQISGGAIGPAADLYALAVTLFEALTGRLPFPGPDIVAQHLSEEPPAPSAVAGASGAGGGVIVTPVTTRSCCARCARRLPSAGVRRPRWPTPSEAGPPTSTIRTTARRPSGREQTTDCAGPGGVPVAKAAEARAGCRTGHADVRRASRPVSARRLVPTRRYGAGAAGAGRVARCARPPRRSWRDLSGWRAPVAPMCNASWGCPKTAAP